MAKLVRSDSRESVFSVSSCVSGIGSWQIGDRARINNRFGTISFIGPTKFAPGEWMGLTLDEPAGKNDGSVAGTRYFTCTANHGLFCKSSKLERVVMTPTRLRSPMPSSSTNPETSKYSEENGYDIGDRVLINGNKAGLLRFLDETEFAKGVWAGVELDAPNGKNDGSVNGKRYFVCKPMYGVFAPAGKTTRAVDQSPAKMMVHHTKTSLLRQQRKHGSRESLCSIGRSSIGSSRYGMPRRTSGQYAATGGDTAAVQALQKALAEKDTHLEHMMTERDIERSEMANLASKYEDLQRRIENPESSSDDTVKTLEEKLTKTHEKWKIATEELMKKKRELEDLRFHMEEESVNKDVAIEELQTQITEIRQQSRSRSPIQESNESVANEQLEAVRNELEQLQRKFAESQTLIDDSKQKEAELQIQLEKAISSLEVSQSLLKESTNKGINLETELEKANAAISAANDSKDSDSSKLQMEIHQLKNDLSATVAELDEARNSLLTATNELGMSVQSMNTMKTECENEISKINNEKESLQSVAMEREQNICELSASLTSARNTVAELESHSGKMESELSIVQKELVEQKSLVQKLTSDKSSTDSIMQQRLNELEDECKQLKNDISLIEEVRNETIKTLNDATKNIKEVEAAKLLLEANVAKLSEECKLKDGSLNEQTSEIEKLKSEVCAAEKLLKEDGLSREAQQNESDRKLSDLTDRLTNLNSVLKTKDEQVEAQSDQLRSTEEKLTRLQNQLTTGTSETGLLKDEIERVEKLVEEKTKELSSAQNEWKCKEEQLNKKVADEEQKSSDLLVNIELLTKQMEQLKVSLSEEKVKCENLSVSSIVANNELKEKLGKLEQEVFEQQQSTTATVDALNDQLEVVKRTLANTEGELSVEKDNATRMQLELTNKQEEVAKYQEQKAKLEEKIASSEQQYRSLQNSVESMKLGGDSIAKNLADAEAELAAKSIHIEHSENKIKGLEADNLAASTTLKEKEASLNNLEQKLRDTSEEKDESIKQLERSLASETTLRSKLESDLRKKSDEIGALVAQIEQVNVASNDQDSRLEAVSSQLLEKEALITKLNNQVESTNGKLETLEQTKKELNERCEASAQETQKLNAELSSLTNQLCGSSEETLQLREMLVKLEDSLKLQEKSSSLSEITSKFEQTFSELATNLENVKQLGEQVSSMSARLTAADTLVDELKEKIKLAEKSEVENTLKLSAYEERVSKQEATMLLQEEKVKFSESAMETMKNEIAVLSSQVTGSTEESEKVNARFEQLQLEIASKTTEVTVLNKDLNDSREEAKQIKENFVKMENDLKLRDEQIQQLSTNISTVSCKLESATSELSSKTDAVISLETQLSELSASLTMSTSSAEELQTKIKAIEEGHTQKTAESETKLAEQQTILQETSEQLLKSQSLTNELKSEIAVVSSQFTEQSQKMHSDIAELRAEREASIAEITQLNDDRNKANEEKEKMAEQIKILSEEFDSFKKESGTNEQALRAELDAEKSRGAQQLKAVEQEVTKLRKEVTLNVEDLEKVKKSDNNEQDKNATELMALQKALEDSQSELAALSVQNAANKQELNSKMANEFAEAMDKVRLMSEERNVIEKEKKHLKTEITTLRCELEQLRTNGNSTSADNLIRQKLEMFEDLEMDMARKKSEYLAKIVELENKLEVAELRTASEYGDLLQREVEFLKSIVAEQLEKIQKLESPEPKDEFDMLDDYTSRVVSPKKLRSYCDICEEFDLHETEDCPTQAMMAAESAKHSHNSPHGKKTIVPREYCDTCEEFGHDTADCSQSKKKKRDYTF